MSGIKKYLSPKSSLGSVVASVAIHALIFGAVVGYLELKPAHQPPTEEYLDLGYEVFDEPPVPTKEEQRVVRSP